MRNDARQPPLSAEEAAAASEAEDDWQRERDQLGQKVRQVWIAYCHEIGDTKPSHIAPWSDLSEQDREADRRIGEELWTMGYAEGAGSAFRVSQALDRLIPLDDEALERYLTEETRREKEGGPTGGPASG